MKTIFLTSFIGCFKKNEKKERVLTKCDNSNGFIDRLKAYKTKLTNFVLVSSNPDGFEKTDEHLKFIVDSLNLDGFGIENVVVLDHRFTGDIKGVISNADLVFLTGGHVPTQNKYLKEIGFENIIKEYEGIIVGQSAGSMNLATTVYSPPESEEDLTSDYQRTFTGMDLTNINIMPHMAFAFDDNVDGNGKNTYDYCLEDSFDKIIYGIYDGGFVEINKDGAVAYGKTLLIKNGACTTICENGECVNLKNNMVENIK